MLNKPIFPTFLTSMALKILKSIRFNFFWSFNDPKESVLGQKYWYLIVKMKSKLNTTWFYLYLKISTVQRTAVSTKPTLCTKWPKFTMLFYYVKLPGSSSPQHPTLQLTGALKWGTAWTSISTGLETTHGQS